MKTILSVCQLKIMGVPLNILVNSLNINFVFNIVAFRILAPVALYTCIVCFVCTLGCPWIPYC